MSRYLHGTAATLILSTLLLPPFANAANRCTADTVFHSDFEIVDGPTLNGVVAGLKQATLEVISGQQVIATGEVVDGAYTVELPALSPQAMIELRVRGLADVGEDAIVLVSLAGTAAQLRDEADPDGITRIDNVPTLAITPESSARYALFSIAANATSPRIGHECALASATAELDPGAVYERAAVMKILIAGITANNAEGQPPSTLDRLIDPALYEAAVDAIDGEQPGRIAALQSVLAEPFCDRFEQPAYLVHGNRLDGTWLETMMGEAYVPTGPSTGQNNSLYVLEDYTISCSGDVAEIAFGRDRYYTTSTFITVNGIPISSIGFWRSGTRLVRIDASEEAIVVHNRNTETYEYPGHPELPGYTQFWDETLAVLREPVGSHFDAATLAGEYLLPTGGFHYLNSANRVVLDTDGTGTDLDANTPLTWAVNPDGALAIDFADRSVLLVPLRDRSPFTRDVLSIITGDDGTSHVTHAFALRRDPMAQWSASSILGTWYRHDSRQRYTAHHATLQANRELPQYRDNGPDLPPVLWRTKYWSLETPDTIVMRYCRTSDSGSSAIFVPILDREPTVSECKVHYERDAWTLYSVDGDVAYVHATTQDFYPGPDGFEQVWLESWPEVQRFEPAQP